MMTGGNDTTDSAPGSSTGNLARFLGNGTVAVSFRPLGGIRLEFVDISIPVGVVASLFQILGNSSLTRSHLS